MPSPLLSYEQAAAQIRLYLERRAGDNAQQSRASEKVPLASAAGRILAEPIHADRDQPPFPRATRDGYACRAADANTHQPLLITGHIRAGQSDAEFSAAQPLQPGQACEIMTGAPVPPGADAVFMVEYSEQQSNFVRMAAPRMLAAGENIVPQGSEAQRGSLLLAAGIRIETPQIALAAQCGYAHLAVMAQPLVAILTTGDELVPIAATPGPSQIRNSNAPMLAALVQAEGAHPTLVLSAADQPELLDAALHRVLDPDESPDHSPDLNIDLLLVSGGISAGRFDLVADALTRRGAHFTFAGVAIQPGKPVAFGHLPAGARQVPFLALPGNPISSAVTFHLFAAPLLAAIGGNTTGRSQEPASDPAPKPRFVLARLAAAWHGKSGLTRFLPAACDFAVNPAVRVIPWQGSGDLAAYARSNCFLVVEPQTSELPAGALVQILLP